MHRYVPPYSKQGPPSGHGLLLLHGVWVTSERKGFVIWLLWSYKWPQNIFHIHADTNLLWDPFFLYVIIPTKLTVESCVAWRAFTSPIAVHTDTPILAKTFLCRHRRRERESMWERESWKVCSSYLKASSYIMLSFFIFFISTCKHWQKVQMVNMCTICWASFICHAVNYVLIRCHFSFTTKFTGAEDYQSARRTSAQYKL